MSVPFYDELDMNNQHILHLPLPENDQDATNKIYVDTQINLARQDLSNEILVKYDEMQTYVDTAVENINATHLSTTQQLIAESIMDNLQTTDADKSLSANMGNVLNTHLNNLDSIVESISMRPDNIYNTEHTVVGQYMGGDLIRFVYTYELPADYAQDLVVDLSDVVSLGIDILNISGKYKITSKTHFLGKSGKLESATEGIYIVNFDRDTRQLQVWISPNTYSLLHSEEAPQIQFVIEYYFE